MHSGNRHSEVGFSGEGKSSHLVDGPISLTRHLLRVAHSKNSISIMYYYSQKFTGLRSTLPYLHFETGKKAARAEVPKKYAKALERCYEFVIRLGKPIVLSRILKVFSEVEPDLTKGLMSKANRVGLYDQYMVPVFGPFGVNGVIAFGFGETLNETHVAEDRECLFCDLEAAAVTHHNRMVRHFKKGTPDVMLSKRENNVLTWIARGKTTKEISQILEISVASVDTYTRRIFEKMGVNTRVEAAIAGVTSGLVKRE